MADRKPFYLRVYISPAHGRRRSFSRGERSMPAALATREVRDSGGDDPVIATRRAVSPDQPIRPRVVW